MPRSMKIFIGILSFLIIVVPLGYFYNPSLKLEYDVKSKSYSQESIDEMLEGKSINEQKKILEEIQSAENRSISLKDDNEYIGDKVFKDIYEVSDEDTVYIIYSKNSDNKVTKEIKKYYKNKHSYEYKIIYLEFEPSLIAGNTYYQSLGGTQEGFNRNSFFLVKKGKIVLESNDYTQLPEK